MTEGLIAKTARIANSVTLGRNVRIMDYSIIHDNVVIEDNVFIGPYSIIGEPLSSFYTSEKYDSPRTIIKKNSLIRSHAVIYAGTTLGESFQTGHSIIIRENSVFGNHCLFGNHCHADKGVNVGDYSRCHSNVYLVGGIRIGEYTCLYPNVLTLDALYPPYRETINPPEIGSRCIIGGGSLILAGVKIGDEAFIGAGSLVSENIPERMLAVGRPAKPVKKIEDIKVPGIDNPYPFDIARSTQW